MLKNPHLKGWLQKGVKKMVQHTVKMAEKTFKDKDNNLIAYVEITTEINGISLRLKPYDQTTSQIIKSFVASKGGKN